MAFPRLFASASRGRGPRPWLSALFPVLLAIACGSQGPAGPDGGAGDLRISATRLSFDAQENEETLDLENRGPLEVPWKAESSAEWLVVSPSSGSLPPGTLSLSVRVVRQLLELGTHNGEISLNLGSETFVVSITAVNTGVALARIEPESLHFGPDDSEATLALSNLGEAPLSWMLSGPAWVTVDPSGGSLDPGGSVEIALQVDRTGLQDGVRTATLSMSSNGGEPGVKVVVEVASPAKLALSPAILDLRDSFNSQTAGVMNTGGRPLTWSASGGQDWATLSRTSGIVKPKTTQPVVVTVSRDGLANGAYETRFTIQSDGGSQDLVVRMQVGSSSPPPPPPPPPPPGGSIALAGRVVDQFSGAGVGGLTVSFAGAGATTDANGEFSIPGDPSSSLRDLRLEGGSIHTRRTFARADDDRWEVIPSNFGMAAFDDVAREYEPRTIRWTQNPEVYIDTRAHNFPGQPEPAPCNSVPQAWLDEAEDAAGEAIRDWSAGVVQAGSVSVTCSPPDEGSPGTIVIEFNEDGSVYSSPQSVGLARTFWAGNRAITSAKIWLRLDGLGDPAVRIAVALHELGHTMGMGHMNGSTSSIMRPAIAVDDLTLFDRRTGDIVYSRSPGNTSPDTDSESTFLGDLAPAGLPEGSYTWVCGVE